MLNKKQYLSNFLGLLEIYRENLETLSDEDFESNILIKNSKYIIPTLEKNSTRKKLKDFEFNIKAENLIESLKQGTIRTLTDEELKHIIQKPSESQHTFFLNKEETNIQNFPLLAVRNLVRKNEFIKYPFISGSDFHDIHNIFISSSKNDKKTKKITHNISLEKKPNSFQYFPLKTNECLSVKKPCYTDTKIKFFEPKIPNNKLINQEYCLSRKRISLPNHIIQVNPPKKQENIVYRHAQGFKNPDNKDFFEHMFRLFLKNKALNDFKKTNSMLRSTSRSNYDFSQLFLHAKTPINNQNNADINENEFSILKIKDIILQKNMMDIQTYEKIIDKYHKDKLSIETPSKPEKTATLKIITISPDYLKFTNQQRYLHEEVFILNILEKAQNHGIKSLHLNEINIFTGILHERKSRIEKMKNELLDTFHENFGSNKKFATIIAATAETEPSDLIIQQETNKTTEFTKKSTILERSNYSGKRNLSYGNMSSIFQEMQETDETIHKNAKIKPGTMIRRREKLKPLTIIQNASSEQNTNSLFGSMELEDLHYRLEAAKKQLIERLDIDQIKGELGQWTEVLDVRRNKKLRKTLKKSSLIVDTDHKIESTTKIKDKMKLFIPKLEIPKTSEHKIEGSKSWFDYGSNSSTKLKEKTLNFNEKNPIKNLQEIKKLYDDMVPAISEEETPKEQISSRHGIISKIHKFAAETQKNQMNNSVDLIVKSTNLSTTGNNPIIPHLSIYKDKKPDNIVIQKPINKTNEIVVKEEKLDKLNEIQDRMKENNRLILENLKNKFAEKIHEEQKIEQNINEKKLSFMKTTKESPKKENSRNSQSSIIDKILDIEQHIPESLNVYLKPEVYIKPEKNNIEKEKFQERLPSSPKEKLSLSPNEKPRNTIKQAKNSIIKPMKEKTEIIKLEKNNDMDNNDFIKEVSPINLGKVPDHSFKRSILLDNSPIKILLNDDQKAASIEQLNNLIKPINTNKLNDNKNNDNEIDSVLNEKLLPSKNRKKKSSNFRKSIKKKISKNYQGQEEIEMNNEDNQEGSLKNMLTPVVRKKNTIDLDIHQGDEVIEHKADEKEHDDLDQMLLQDMASLDKKAMRIQHYKNKNSIHNLSVQNSAESYTPKSIVDINSNARRTSRLSKDQILQNEDLNNLSKNSKPKSHLDSNNISIEEDRYKDELFINDPLLQNLNTKPLRLSALWEIQTQDMKSSKNFPFWEENPTQPTKIDMNAVNNSTINLKNTSVVSPNKKLLSGSSPNNFKFSNTFQQQQQQPENDEKNKSFMKGVNDDTEPSKDDINFFLNATPYLKTKSKKLPNEKDENPYAKLKTLMGTEQLMQPKKSIMDQTQKSKTQLESLNSSFSQDLDLNELVQYELKKTENFKIGDIKQGIEENIQKMSEAKDLDEEGKFNIMLYENRKEQIQKYIELATENHQNWLMQPDCIEQLKNFLNEKNKNFNDYEKNSNLKFCMPIQIPKNDAIQTLNELTKNNASILNNEEQEKLVEFLMKMNEEVNNERERKKKFKVEKEMVKILKNYLTTFKSSVKQTSLKQKTMENSVGFDRVVKQEIKRNRMGVSKANESKASNVKNDENHSKSNSMDTTKFSTFAKKLKILKEHNIDKFNQIVKKCESIKSKQYAYY